MRPSVDMTRQPTDCFKSVETQIDAYLPPERLDAVDEGVRLFLDEYLVKYVCGRDYVHVVY